MTRPRTKAAFAVAAGVAVLTGAAPAVAVGPSLTIEAGCETTAVTVCREAQPVSIRFTAGSDETTTMPNRVAALDLRLTFPDEALTVSGVRLAPGLGTDKWGPPQWEGSLFPDDPLPAGEVSIRVAPLFQAGVPTFPDGPLLEVDFEARPDVHACAGIAFDAAAVIFSDAGQGLEVPAGPLTGGGLAVDTPGDECNCGNCVDDDADGLVDLADDDCPAAGASLTAVKIKRAPARKPQKGGKAVLKATLPVALVEADVAGGIALSVDAGVDGSLGTSLVCRDLAAASSGRADSCERKQKRKFKVKDPAAGIKKVILKRNCETGTTALTAKLKQLALPAELTDVGVSLRVGERAYHGQAQVHTEGKKVVFP